MERKAQQMATQKKEKVVVQIDPAYTGVKSVL